MPPPNVRAPRPIEDIRVAGVVVDDRDFGVSNGVVLFDVKHSGASRFSPMRLTLAIMGYDSDAAQLRGDRVESLDPRRRAR